MQEKFLNPMIKVEEEDSNEMYVENNERDIFDEQQFDVGSIKMEPSNGKFRLELLLPNWIIDLNIFQMFWMNLKINSATKKVETEIIT